jgi:hypothetical protein
LHRVATWCEYPSIPINHIDSILSILRGIVLCEPLIERQSEIKIGNRHALILFKVVSKHQLKILLCFHDIVLKIIQELESLLIWDLR